MCTSPTLTTLLLRSTRTPAFCSPAPAALQYQNSSLTAEVPQLLGDVDLLLSWATQAFGKGVGDTLLKFALDCCCYCSAAFGDSCWATLTCCCRGPPRLLVSG